MFHHPKDSAYRLDWICENHYLGMSDEEMDWWEEQKWRHKEKQKEKYGWWSERRWAVEFGLVPRIPRGSKRLDADDVRELSTLSEIIGQYTPVKRMGDGKWSAKCPFHEDSSPSLSIADSTSAWHCHAGCGGGNIFHFLMRIEKIDFTQAVQALSAYYGKHNTVGC